MYTARPIHYQATHLWDYGRCACTGCLPPALWPINFLESHTLSITYRFGSATAPSWLEPFHLGAKTMHNRIQTPIWVAIIAIATALMVGGLTAPIVHSST